MGLFEEAQVSQVSLLQPNLVMKEQLQQGHVKWSVQKYRTSLFRFYLNYSNSERGQP